MTQQWKRDQIGAWFWSRPDLAEEFVVTELCVGQGLMGSPMGWAASVDTTPMLLRPSRRQSLQHPKRALRRTFIALLLMLSPTIAFAQTDEIQVYDAEIAAPGVYNLMVHNNYTFDGLKVPRFPGGLVPDHTLNGVPEWAYGVTDWFEQGLYLPLYSDASNLGPVLNGFKVRELFVVPHAAEQTFFYGINFEFSYNAKHWDPNQYSSEIRPIVGWHLGKFDLIINPIFDNPWKGFNNLDFAPSARIAYNVSTTWAVAVEQYSDFGVIQHFLSPSQQSQQLFGVIDYKGEPFDVEAGLGFGLTGASDRLVAKLMLSRDLNKPDTPSHSGN